MNGYKLTMVGQLLLIICCIFYLIWWSISYRPRASECVDAYDVARDLLEHLAEKYKQTQNS